MARCTQDGCTERAVSVPLSQLDPPEVRKDHCRPHYLTDAAESGDLVLVKVVARVTVCGADRVDVGRGGTAVLDRRDTNIPMLEDEGIVEVLPMPKAKADKGEPKG